MPAPWFFVSYAPVPPPGGTGVGRPSADKNVREFYADLTRAVVNLGGALTPPSVGYLDSDREESAVRALNRCRVFVPLITARYFADPYCGRQWTAFTRRAHRGTLVPALWTPVPTTARPVRVDLDLPQPARPGTPVHVDDEALDGYARGGLYGLRQHSDRPEYYDQCVGRIAQGIVQAALGTSEPAPGEAEFTDLEDVPDAFAATSWHPLDIAVLAPDIHHLPVGRSDIKYGPEPRDWQPYSDGYGTALAERTAELARNVGFAPQIRTYDEAEPVFLGHRPTRSPWVLILDPWVLRDPEAVRRLREFDARDLPWVTVLTPIADDPQTRQARADLDALLKSALPRRLSRGRAIQRGAILGLDNSEAFSSRFMELANSAAHHYLNRDRLRSSTTKSSAPTDRRHVDPQGDQEAPS